MKNKILISLSLLAILSSCKKDEDPTILLNKSTGAIVQLNGIANNEAGSVAGNAVYVDFSTEKSTAVLRKSWDIGLFSGVDFKVKINNTTGAGAKILAKFDLNTVTTSDTAGLVLATSQFNPEAFHFTFFDNLSGDLNRTVIPTVLAVDALNPVIIINRGTGGGVSPRAWIKMRVLRNGNGYTVQYAGLNETNFRSINVAKNDLYNFQFVSFENGIVNNEPEKLKWDMVWSYGQYQANFGNGFVPYNFSDLIEINYLAGVEVKEKVYADANTAAQAFNNFNRDSIIANPVAKNRWAIANNWRSTQPATGAKLDRFYIIKDPNGNYYKMKCLAMGVGTDGGTRGKPEFKYSLIP
jgi:hypothetical protein